jgi:hypothetical protein
MQSRLQYYEELVKFHSAVLQEQNPRLTGYASELRSALEACSILRHMRLLEGIEICCGDGHCDAEPTAACVGGKHKTCPKHTEECYLCDSAVLLTPLN